MPCVRAWYTAEGRARRWRGRLSCDYQRRRRRSSQSNGGRTWRLWIAHQMQPSQSDHIRVRLQPDPCRPAPGPHNLWRYSHTQESVYGRRWQLQGLADQSLWARLGRRHRGLPGRFRCRHERRDRISGLFNRRSFTGQNRLHWQLWWVGKCSLLANGSRRIRRTHPVRQRRHTQLAIHGLDWIARQFRSDKSESLRAGHRRRNPIGHTQADRIHSRLSRGWRCSNTHHMHWCRISENWRFRQEQRQRHIHLPLHAHLPHQTYNFRDLWWSGHTKVPLQGKACSMLDNQLSWSTNSISVRHSRSRQSNHPTRAKWRSTVPELKKAWKPINQLTSLLIALAPALVSTTHIWITFQNSKKKRDIFWFN